MTLESTLVLLKQDCPGQGDKSKTVPDFIAFLLTSDFSTSTAKRLKCCIKKYKIMNPIVGFFVPLDSGSEV
jgi:hypothetical protein